MSVFSRLSLAFIVAALSLGGRTACAQVNPMTYWTPGWPLGFSDNAADGQGANTYGNFPSFDAQGGFSSTRTNFPNGWFVGGGRSMGLNLSGLNQTAAFSNFGSLYTEGVQVGYNFKNAPISVYAGFDTLKYDAGIGGPLSPFDSRSGTVPGYSSTRVGVEYRPTSNLSLSLGVGYTQQSSDRIDSDINSPLLPGATPFAFGGRR